jgi:hypothetical protein
MLSILLIILLWIMVATVEPNLEFVVEKPRQIHAVQPFAVGDTKVLSCQLFYSWYLNKNNRIRDGPLVHLV